jgi:hypothetical protein
MGWTKEWNNRRLLGRKLLPGQKYTFTRRIRWYDSEDGSVDLELLDEGGTVRVYFDDAAHAQPFWEAFKAGTETSQTVKGRDDVFMSPGTRTGRARRTLEGCQSNPGDGSSYSCGALDCPVHGQRNRDLQKKMEG